MVDYRTRIFFEKDSKVMGADILIYSEAGDLIDRILVTSNSSYVELSEKIDNIDNTYIDKDELITYLQNVVTDLEINATKLNGIPASNYSQVGHTHGNDYAVRNHASTTNNFGLGSNSLYGHVKLVDNLNSQQLVQGEALSAHQGNVLKGLIDETNENISGYNVAYFDNPITSVVTTCKIALKKVGNIVFCQYHVNYKSPKQENLRKDIRVSNRDIPEGYRPASPSYNSVAEYDSNNNMLLFFDTDGKIYCRGYKKTTVNVYGTCFWFTDLKFWD